MRRLLLPMIVGAVLTTSSTAEAQYRNFTFGFEGGYAFFDDATALKSNNFALGMFGGFKLSDHWWINSKALLSFPGQLDQAPNTVIGLQVAPASVRYYLSTDAFRPYGGLTNTFLFLSNTSENFPQTVWWGPGIDVGLEFKLRRDLFLGLSADAYYMFNFEGPAAPVINATAQVIFFL